MAEEQPGAEEEQKSSYAEEQKSSQAARTPYLPFWSQSPGLKQLYSLAESLVKLWEDSGATDDERLIDTDAFAAVASKDLQQHIENWKQRGLSLEARCEALRAKAQCKLDMLVGQIDEELLNALSAELKGALGEHVLRARLSSLQKVESKISRQLDYLHELQQAFAEAMRVLGLDPSNMPGGVAALEQELSRLKGLLLQRRMKALQTLGEADASMELATDSKAEEVRLLALEVERLEARVAVLQSEAVTHALRARSLWEELGEEPKLSRDSHAVRISSSSDSAALAENWQSCIDSTIADAIDTSLAAWEARRSLVLAEVERIHAQLRAFGAKDDVEPFLRKFGTLHRSDREACRLKLDEVLAEIRAAEAQAREHLQHLYDEVGFGAVAFAAFEDKLDGAESREVRARMLAKETKRLERYLESIMQILGPLKELKALVEAAVAFEANVQAGKTRFAGNSLHFLEEEKFRRRFAARYPELRDGLIEAIAVWEAREGQKFVYYGLELREGLLSIQGHDVALVRVPGDLSSMGQVVKLLHIPEQSPAPPPPKRQRPRALDQSPGRSPVGPSTPGSVPRSQSSSASPVRRRKAKRERSGLPGVPGLPLSPEMAVPAPPPRDQSLSPQKLPRCPEGPGRGQLAAMAAVNIASGMRPPLMRRYASDSALPRNGALVR